MIIQCCKCKTIIGTKPPYGKQSGDISHTYCETCLEIEMAKLDNLEWLAYLVQRRDEAGAEFLKELREANRIADNMRSFWTHKADGAEEF